MDEDDGWGTGGGRGRLSHENSFWEREAAADGSETADSPRMVAGKAPKAALANVAPAPMPARRLRAVRRVRYRTRRSWGSVNRVVVHEHSFPE